MDSSDVLLTTAEVAITFAGFTGLIAIVARRGHVDRKSEEFFRLRTMLDYSLGALFAALFPFLPEAAGVSGSSLWQLSSAALLIGAAVYYGLNLTLMREWSRTEGGPRRIGAVGELVALGALAVNAAGWPLEPSFFVYLVALFWCLLGAAIGFVQFVSLIWFASAE